MKKFRVWASLKSIKEIEIEREIEKCVWINGQRSNKTSIDFYQFFDTRKECIDYLIKIKKNQVNLIFKKEERLLNQRIELKNEIIELQGEK